MTLTFRSALLTLLVASPAMAGVTIHFEGRARDRNSVERAIVIATEEAQRLGWKVENGDAASVSITRVVGESDRPYKGPLRGIVIRAHPMCEPFHLQFGSDLFLQDYVKTQFAGPDVHIALTTLLRKIKPFFKSLHVEDEGEYWTTNDRAILTQNLKANEDMMKAIKKARPEARGPVRLPGDRIADIVQ